MTGVQLDHVQIAAPPGYVGVERSFSPALKAHPALRVSPEELDALAHRLKAADATVLWDDALPGERRFYSDDPWGNRIEFLATAVPHGG